ncbi:MAG TPA: TatD family deoxyribonuclease [Phycisphaerales bacterium]|nr:TatD family deoxyribonuclease [Phycisphaerales bacterium]
MELIDTHAHFTFPELQAGVTSWVTVATEPGGLEKAIDLAEKFENMHVALGYHTHYAKDVTVDDLSQLKQLAASDSVVAVGETGLDYHYNFSKQDAQKDIFRAQLNIAAELKKPVILHTRNAFDESMVILIKKGSNF